jgi:hypothetical protein
MISRAPGNGLAQVIVGNGLTKEVVAPVFIAVTTFNVEEAPETMIAGWDRCVGFPQSIDAVAVGHHDIQSTAAMSDLDDYGHGNTSHRLG